jgi:hypothetical protein
MVDKAEKYKYILHLCVAGVLVTIYFLYPSGDKPAYLPLASLFVGTTYGLWGVVSLVKHIDSSGRRIGEASVLSVLWAFVIWLWVSTLQAM